MKTLAISLLAGTALVGFASASYAADLIIEEPAAEVGIVDVSGSWDGAFIGAFVGGGWADADHLANPPNNDLELAGWLVGIDAGFNFTVGSGLVLGVVGDIAWADITGDDGGAFAFDTTHTIDWQGSLRGRVGFDGGAFMPYLTAGVAFAHGERTTSLGSPNSAEATHWGWTVGAGVEFAVSEELSVDLLYRYSDLSEELYDWSGPGTNPTIGLTSHTIQAGLHWNF
jgi:outer membrane immunogenic protein